MRLNPGHPVSQEMEGQYHKLLAIFMKKTNTKRFIIEEADVQALSELGDMPCVVVHAHKDNIEVLLLMESEAEKLIAKESPG